MPEAHLWRADMKNAWTRGKGEYPVSVFRPHDVRLLAPRRPAISAEGYKTSAVDSHAGRAWQGRKRHVLQSDPPIRRQDFGTARIRLAVAHALCTRMAWAEMDPGCIHVAQQRKTTRSPGRCGRASLAVLPAHIWVSLGACPRATIILAAPRIPAYPHPGWKPTALSASHHTRWLGELLRRLQMEETSITVSLTHAGAPASAAEARGECATRFIMYVRSTFTHQGQLWSGKGHGGSTSERRRKCSENNQRSLHRLKRCCDVGAFVLVVDPGDRSMSMRSILRISCSPYPSWHVILVQVQALLIGVDDVEHTSLHIAKACSNLHNAA